MDYYKIISRSKKHHGMKYKKGLNEDYLIFLPYGNCQPGGLYFSREDILAFIGYGHYVCKVTLPEGEDVYEDPDDYPKKWKAHRIILGPFKRLTTKKVEELISEGATVNQDTLDRIIQTGNLNMVRVLLKHGVKPGVRSFDLAVCSGLTKIFQELLKYQTLEQVSARCLMEHAARYGMHGHASILKVIFKAGLVDPATITDIEVGDWRTERVAKKYLPNARIIRTGMYCSFFGSLFY